MAKNEDYRTYSLLFSESEYEDSTALESDLDDHIESDAVDIPAPVEAPLRKSGSKTKCSWCPMQFTSPQKLHEHLEKNLPSHLRKTTAVKKLSAASASQRNKFPFSILTAGR
ncbi:hypothetical protein KCU81_g2048, partial [Aureobasidium melanogenum]|uniref:Uncharacterized protein n=1 Tax=Aureobasidium melanogenum (strain CBS 110374) TaxID=1043003 RepID=A0A074VWX3_AURM1